MSQCCIASCERSQPELYLYSMTLVVVSNHETNVVDNAVDKANSDKKSIDREHQYL